MDSKTITLIELIFLLGCVVAVLGSLTFLIGLAIDTLDGWLERDDDEMGDWQ